MFTSPFFVLAREGLCLRPGGSDGTLMLLLMFMVMTVMVTFMIFINNDVVVDGEFALFGLIFPL
jgi:hypothetical protein